MNIWAITRCLLTVVGISVFITPFNVLGARSLVLSIYQAPGTRHQELRTLGIRRFLLRRSVSGPRLGRRGGLGEGFINQATYFDTILHSLIDHKPDRGCKPRLQALGQ